MSEAVREFAMLETGWRSGAAPVALSVEGATLKAELREFSGDNPEVLDVAGEAEEVAAVLEGSFQLRSDSDCYTLEAGQAVLIPPKAARCWKLVSPRGTLYRVWRHAGAV